jgi:hypothetical protein
MRKSTVDTPPESPAHSERLNPRQAERAFYAELVSQLQQLVQSMTTTMTRVLGRSVNNVIETATKVFPTGDGYLPLSYRTPLGSITVRAGAHAVTVSAGGPSSTGTVPTQGAGIWVVPANTRDTIALTGHQVTLYGTATESVSYQVFAAGPTPAA